MDAEALRLKLRDYAKDEASYAALESLFSDLLREHIEREQILHDNSSLAWKIINASPDLIFLMDTEGKTLAVNDAGLAHLNQPRRLLHGQDPAAFMSAEMAEKRRDIFREVLEQNESVRMVNRRDGIYLDEIYFPVSNASDETTGIAVIGRDVSEQKRVEERMWENETFLRSFVQQSNDGICMMDERGQVIEWNPALALISGYDRQQARRQLYWDLWGTIVSTAHHQADWQQQLQGFVQETLQHGRRCSADDIGAIYVDWQDRSVRELRMEIFPIPVANRWMAGVIVRDVTRQKQLEQTLEARERQYRLVVDNAKDVIFQTDIAGDWVFLNPAWTVMTERSIEESLNTSLFDLFTGDADDECRQAYARLMSGDMMECVREFKFTTASGILRDLELFATVIIDDAEQIIGASGMIRDITERKRAERVSEAHTRLQIAYEQERELHELKRRMMERIEHEFRTPLSIIMTKNYILKKYIDGITPEQKDGHHQNITQAVEGMEAMLNEIEFIVRGQGQMADYLPESFDIEHHVRNIIVNVANQQHHAHTLQLEVANDVRSVQINPELLRHIVAPLVSNAIKFSEAGTEVLVQVQAERGHLVITVRDAGIGILLEDAPHIFDAFFRGHNFDELPGLGIGLTKVHEVVEANDGRIFFEANAAGGTTFVVTLPVKIGEAEV